MSDPIDYSVLTGASKGGRFGRIYYRKNSLTLTEAADVLSGSLDDIEDEGHIKLLRDGLIARPKAVFVTHRVCDAPDVINAFLRVEIDGREQKVHACIFMSQDRLYKDLEEEPFIVEGINLQVCPFLEGDGLQAAIEMWCSRMFPGLSIDVVVEPWKPEEVEHDA